MEQIPRGPQEDDCQLAKVRSENLLVETLLGNAIMALEVMCGGNTEPNTTSGRVLG